MSTAKPSSLAPEGSEPGLHLERRTLLAVPLAVLGGRVVAAAPRQRRDEGQDEGHASAAAEGPFAPLALPELGRRWQALATELRLAPAACDESYAAQLAGLVARLPLASLPPLEKPRTSPGLAAGPTWFLAPCVMIEFRLEPRAELRLHNHPPQVVLTLCAEGEVAFRHFEIEGEAPPCTEKGGTLWVRESRAGFLTPGRSTSLTRVRDGIHGFVAGARGARIVDFTVATTEDIETFSYIGLEELVEPERRVHAARWLGK